MAPISLRRSYLGVFFGGGARIAHPILYESRLGILED